LRNSNKKESIKDTAFDALKLHFTRW